MRDFIRLLTGRIAFERRARLVAADLATDPAYCNMVGDTEYAAARIYHFLMTGEFPA